MSKTTFTLKRKLFGGGFAGSTFGRVLGINNWSNLGHMATTYTLKRKTFAKMSERTLEDLHKIVASAPEGNTVRAAAQQELSRRTAVTPFTPPPTNNQPPKASQTNMGASQTNIGATTTPKTKTSPGFGKRIINRWNNMSTLGKVGVGATAAVGVGLATNAILNNKKKKEQQQ